MKSIRHTLLSALRDDELTLDDLLSLTDLPRKQLHDNLHACKKEDLLSVRRDEATGLPAYRLTEAGRARLDGIEDGSIIKGGRKSPSASKATAPALTKTPGKLTVSDGAYIVAIADIRDAIGDSEGRLTLDDVVESIREIAERADQHDALQAERDQLRADLAELAKMNNENAAKLVRVENQRAELALAQSDDRLLSALMANQYLILSPKRKPQRVKSHAKAQDIALSAARAHGMAEVYALVPAGRAIRGAVWR